MKTLKDLGDLKGKRVLVRADFNVPLDGTTITDDGRIKAALPTIKALREEGAKVILMAHLGRPKGKVVPELSLAPVAARLGELLGIEVPLAEDTYGEDAQAKVAAMGDGDVVLHGLIHRTATDHQHRSAAEIVACHVDPVLMLLGDAVLQKQRQEQKRADRRKSGLVDQAAVFGGVFGVLKLVVAPMGGDIRKRAFHAKLLLQ